MGTRVLSGSDGFGLCVLKDYELLVLTYRALQDPMASPLKKPRMECASDDIIQEVRNPSSSCTLHTCAAVAAIPPPHPPHPHSSYHIN